MLDVLEPVITSIPSPATAKGKYGIAVRTHGADSPEAAEARANLAEANIAAAIKAQIVESRHRPTLSTEAKARLIALLDG
jgi:hypothetical protein